MRYRSIADTGIEVSVIGFGMWTLSEPAWGSREERDSIALLHEAIDLGVTLFETADVHGRGYGEELLAQAAWQEPQPLRNRHQGGLRLLLHPTHGAGRGSRRRTSPQPTSAAPASKACDA